MPDSHSRSGPPKTAQRLFAPIALALAGRRWFPLHAIIHHHGRRSGTEFATPIAVIPTLDKNIILIGLPWGAKTNWAPNVKSARGATLIWKGSEHWMAEPRIISGSDAAALAKGPFGGVVGRMPAAIALTCA